MTNELLAEISILKEKLNKYKWHDLRQDPNDVPETEGYYLVKEHNQEIPFVAFYDGYDWHREVYGTDQICEAFPDPQKSWVQMAVENMQPCGMVTNWKCIEKV